MRYENFYYSLKKKEKTKKLCDVAIDKPAQSSGYFGNIKRIFPYVIICAISLIVFLIPLGNSDELWNYNFGRNISMGMLPYKDFSMIQTPLSAYLSAVFIKLFGH